MQLLGKDEHLSLAKTRTVVTLCRARVHIPVVYFTAMDEVRREGVIVTRYAETVTRAGVALLTTGLKVAVRVRVALVLVEILVVPSIVASRHGV